MADWTRRTCVRWRVIWQRLSVRRLVSFLNWYSLPSRVIEKIRVDREREANRRGDSSWLCQKSPSGEKKCFAKIEARALDRDSRPLYIVIPRAIFYSACLDASPVISASDKPKAFGRPARTALDVAYATKGARCTPTTVADVVYLERVNALRVVVRCSPPAATHTGG